MSFRLDRFSVLRPYRFHLTATANLRRIRRQRELRAAAGLFREAGFIEDSSKRRVDHRYLNIDGDVVMVRDQKPLHRGTAGDVVEVVFNGVLRLPNATVVADAYNGRWRALLRSGRRT
jgi:hypothetical protein